MCVFVTGSTAAVTTMEYEPGGVPDLQALVERLVPRARLSGDYQHNVLNHDDNAHAHLRASLVGPSLSIPADPREPRARHLAAARPDRLRRPAAGTVGPRADRVLRRSRWLRGTARLRRLLRKWRPLRGLVRPGEARYTPLPAREPGFPGERDEEESPQSPGATVFENSTACAPDGRLRPIVYVRPGSIRRRPSCRRRPEKSRSTCSTPSRCPGPLHVYEQPSQWRFDSST